MVSVKSVVKVFLLSGDHALQADAEIVVVSVRLHGKPTPCRSEVSTAKVSANDSVRRATGPGIARWSETSRCEWVTDHNWSGRREIVGVAVHVLSYPGSAPPRREDPRSRSHAP